MLFSDIPSDILFTILSRVSDPFHLLVLKSVCKNWCEVINQIIGVEGFFDAQLCKLEKSTLPEDWKLYGTIQTEKSNGRSVFTSLDVGSPNICAVPHGIAINSCYGLVLYESAPESLNFYVGNPVTGSSWQLPPLDDRFSDSAWQHCAKPSIGFDLSTRAFKVVYFIYRTNIPDWGDPIYVVLVHTLGTSNWRECTVDFYPPTPHELPSIYMKGSLNWFSEDYNCLFSLNLHEERLSCTVPFEFRDLSTFLLWKGSLAVAEYGHDDSDNYTFDIWVLEKDDSGEQWSRGFHFSHTFISSLCAPYRCRRSRCGRACHIELRASLRNGEVMVFAFSCGSHFFYYDIVNNVCLKHFEVGEEHVASWKHFPHFNTLIKKEKTSRR